MPRTPEGPPPPPAVQKLRLRYAKRGRLRFSSHRDFQRALERALRRAGVPMAYSAGFTPHPKVSYANAASTGAASEAEYVELSLTRRVDPQALREALDRCLPAGLDVLEVVQAAPGALADRLEASDWEIVLPGVEAKTLGQAVTELMARERVPVQRLMKTGLRTFDARGPLVCAQVVDPAQARSAAGRAAALSQPECAILRAVVRHTTPAVRPDDVLAALRVVADLVPPSPAQVTRLAQGPLEAAGSVADPLAAGDHAGDA